MTLFILLQTFIVLSRIFSGIAFPLSYMADEKPRQGFG